MKKFLVGFLLASLVFGGGVLVAGNITDTGWSQKDVVAWMTEIQSRINTVRSVNYTSGALAIGTDNTTFQNAAAINYVINGTLYAKAATDNIAWTAGHTSQDNNTICAYLVSVVAAGTVTTTQGTILTGATGDPTIPACPASSAPIGIIKVKNLTGAAFIPDNTALNTGSLTVTYVNIIGPYSNETADLALTGW